MKTVDILILRLPVTLVFSIHNMFIKPFHFLLMFR